MSKSKPAPVTPHDPEVDWARVDVQHLEYGPGAMIFVQGDPATSVMYVEQGTVQLSVVSHAGKEAVIAVLEAGRFFGEGCLVGQPQRMATASAMAASTIISVEKPEMVRQLHASCRLVMVSPRRLSALCRKCHRKRWQRWWGPPARA